MSNPILLAPGPVQLHPEVQKILSLPMIHHRTPEFDKILARVLLNLKYLFQTQQPVFMHTSTGSGGMESLLVNLLSPNDKVLAVVSGKFGERWADMAETFGARVHRLNIEWGHAVNPADVKKFLSENPDTKIVMTQACETSTATSHPIQQLGKIVAETDALFLVDGITATGAFPTPMDDWNIDGLVAGSQKAVMLPTGLSFVSLSEKAWAVANKATTARFYFDLRKELKANKNGETLFSAPVPLVRALDYILTRIQEIGLTTHFKQLSRRAEFTRSQSSHLGLTLFSKSPSDSVTALKLPEGLDGAKLRTHIEEKYLLTVMGGQDQLKGKILRLGHMGYIPDTDLIQTQVRLAKSLNDFGSQISIDKIESEAVQWLKAHQV